jgi:hypothetical protein
LSVMVASPFVLATVLQKRNVANRPLPVPL